MNGCDLMELLTLGLRVRVGVETGQRYISSCACEERRSRPAESPLPPIRPSDVPFCQFRCLGNVRIKADNHHEDSYWKSGFLNRMLEPTNNAPTPHHNGRVTLFGFNWSRQMSTDALDKLFCILRQEFSLLQREANKAGLSFQTVTTGRDGEKCAGGERASMFTCTCVWELWLLVVKLTEWRAEKCGSEKPSVSETVLRRHLRTMVLLTANWEPNTAILVTLWDNFYKRLNETFQMSSGRVDGLAWMESSAAALYDRCTQIATGQYDSLERETSFQLFLRLLSNHLGRLYRNGDTQQWKQFKGRIYSKFHAKRVQDLLEGGLYNLTSLFLTLAITADLHDVASKLVDFYDMLDISSVSFARRSVVWRGVLALMLVHVNERLDIGFLVDRMVPSFEAAVKAFSEADTDSRHYLWGLILLYMEGLQDVVETNFSSALWRFVYSFVMDHAQTNTPPTVIGDMAASFCLLSLHNSLDDSTSTVSVFQYFTSSEKVNVSVSGRFLSQLLGSAPVMEHLENRVDGLDDCLVAVWVRLAILLPGTDNTLQDISRSLVQLKTVREVLPDPGADLQHVPVNFFKALEARHASLESWQEKMEFQKRVSGYFADVGKHVSPLLKFLQPCESVYNMYHMVGCVVKYCAKLIYVKKSASMTTAVHPVVGSLRNSFTQQPGIEVLKFRRYIMDLILSQYLAVTSMKINPSHALGFAFVHEVLQRTTSSEVKAGDLAVILKPCLEYLLLLANTDPSWTLVLQCVQLTSQAYNSHTDSIPMNELSNVTRKFVNGYFKFSSTGVVQVIEKLALLLPGVTASVITLISEKSQYYEVLKLLGEDGKEEISRLEAHTGVS
ncbi:MMS22-like protein [Mya arenaria]|uniref:Protein MMS22-like n=1 Tax=Mya arenaria TaxID=6604 RepID=A0ABY7ECV3_MYAAR|nr:MMS22-like protein [Mya arenaria]